jgi:hypothetical protein
LLVDGRLPAVDLLAVLLTPPVDLRDFPAVDFGGMFAIRMVKKKVSNCLQERRNEAIELAPQSGKLSSDVGGLFDVSKENSYSFTCRNLQVKTPLQNPLIQGNACGKSIQTRPAENEGGWE